MSPVDGTGNGPVETTNYLPLIGVGVCLLAVVAAMFLLRGWWWSLLALKFRFWGAVLLLLGLGGLALLVAFQPWPVQVLAILATAAVLVWLVLRRTRSSSTVNRWGNQSRRAQGVASSSRILRHGSAVAVRRKAKSVRPSLADTGRIARATMRTAEFGILLARVGALHMWSSIEDVVLIFGGPRTGKSGWLAGRIIDAPGAAVVTSTRPDLHILTAALRGGRGPVHIFNAVGLGGLGSTISFDPLIGCADPVTAAERAADMLAAGSVARGGDREFWEAQARRVLGSFLHAAALGELGMRDVLRWVADPEQWQREVAALLRRSPEPAYVQDATQFVTTNPNTRSSITSTIMPALSWLTSPAAVAASSGAAPLDVAALLTQRGTVYLLGGEESQAAPLVCALTGHIAREARRLAALQPGGRLDPPLGLYLDEAALISPVPLDKWTADMGGRGVTIVGAFQSYKQLQERWGDNGAGIILNNAGAVMLFGGTKDPKDLSLWSSLAGQRDERNRNFDKHGKPTGTTTTKVDVLPPAQLSNLPEGHAVIFRRGLQPAIGRVRMAWNRADVKRASARRPGWTRPAAARFARGARAFAQSRPAERAEVGDRG